MPDDSTCPECGGRVDIYTDEPLFLEPGLRLTRTRHCTSCDFHEVTQQTTREGERA